MVGREKGFVALFTKYVGYPQLDFHCIEQEEALCAKAGLKVASFIPGHALKKCNFRIC
jgi:hypothetical protein